MLKTECRLENRASRHLLSCKRNCQHFNLCSNMEYIMMFPERSLKLVKLTLEIPVFNHQHICGTEQFGVRKIKSIPSGINGPSINGRIYYEANCHDIQCNLFIHAIETKRMFWSSTRNSTHTDLKEMPDILLTTFSHAFAEWKCNTQNSLSFCFCFCGLVSLNSFTGIQTSYDRPRVTACLRDITHDGLATKHNVIRWGHS